MFVEQDRALLRWQVENDTVAAVVHVAGEVDLSTELDFADAIGEGMAGSAPVVVVDLAGVTFLGSNGIRVLLQAHEDATQANRALRIADGSSVARRVIQLTGVDQVLAVFASVEQALTA